VQIQIELNWRIGEKRKNKVCATEEEEGVFFFFLFSSAVV